jgi:hypothetical protein
MSRGKSRKTRTVYLVFHDDLWALKAGEPFSKRSLDEGLEWKLFFETVYSGSWGALRGLPFCLRVEHLPRGVRTKYFEAGATELAKEIWLSYEFDVKDFVVVSEPTLSHREHFPATRSIEVRDEAEKHRELAYLVDTQKGDPDEPGTTSDSDQKRSDEPDQSSEERLAEIRTALNESRELGEQTKKRIDALIGRSS